MEKSKYLNKSIISEKVKSKINILEKNPDVEAIYCLLETHMKGTAETPSSVVTKTNKKTIYPFYSSNSMNCGMGLMKTNIDVSLLDEQKIIDLFQKIDDRITISLLERYMGKKEVSKKELFEILFKGVDAIPKRYLKLNNAFELKGNFFKNKNFSKKDILRTIPSFLLKGATQEIGKSAGGNHFLEFQTPTEIFDDSFGIKKNKLYFMLHMGTGYLGDNITGIYCNRKKKPFLYSIIVGPRFYSFKKLLFLLKRRGFKFVKNNWNLLFRNKNLFLGIEYDSEHGKDFLKAETAVMNFGFVWRHIIYSLVSDILKKEIKQDMNSELLLDRSHNTIYDTEKAIYYTRNACKINEHDLFILPGDDKNHSFLLKAGPKLKEVEFSIDHGLGVLLKKDSNKKETNEVVYRFARNRFFKKRITYKKKQLQDSQRTLKKLQEMEKKGYFKIIARLKPIANLK